MWLKIRSVQFYVWDFMELQVEFDESGKCLVVTSEAETAKCKKVVCDPSYVPDKVIKIGIIG